VKIKNLDPETTSDLIMHPGMFQGQNEYALCISVTGLREVRRIKIVPGKQAFPNLVRYRTSAKQCEVSTPDGEAGDASDTMCVFSVAKRPSKLHPSALEYYVEKQVYTPEYLESLI
jgi:hypothetical protein